MHKNIVHKYFRKKFDDLLMLVQVDPEHYTGIEMSVVNGQILSKREMVFDEEIFEDLAEDGFEEANALEFNLYAAGLSGIMP